MQIRVGSSPCNSMSWDIVTRTINFDAPGHKVIDTWSQAEMFSPYSTLSVALNKMTVLVLAGIQALLWGTCWR